MQIHHSPNFDTDKICEHYTEKDGVPVKYVCTTDLRASDRPVDVFYRNTPHPEFGNHYFGIFYDVVRDHTMICNADIIEELQFGMVVGPDDRLYYSQSHHDYKHFEDGKSIDGGRAYTRGFGYEMYKVKDGEFIRDYGEPLTNWIKDSEDKYVYPGSDPQE